jgi:hypothetical protein
MRLTSHHCNRICLTSRDAPASFKQTQLYRELAQCQAALVESGAATAVEIDLGQHGPLQTELPFHAAAATIE